MSTRQYVLPRESQGPLHAPRLAYIGTSQFSAEWDSTPHTHTCAELFFITAGSGRFQAQQAEFPVSAHDLVVVNPGVLHTEQSQPENAMEYTVLGVDGLETPADVTGCAVLHLGASREEFTGLLNILLSEARRELPGYGEACQSLLRVILLRLDRLADLSISTEPSTVLGAKVNRECDLVRRYIDNHFKENLTLDRLAAMAHISKYYLAHVFRQAFGVSPIAYLISRRIDESRFLLRETDHSLSQIAQILGFSSLSYFSQCFRRSEGMSPMEYRKLSQSQKETGS